jgi:hypothetical protein
LIRQLDCDGRRLFGQILELVGLMQPGGTPGRTDQEQAGEQGENAPGPSRPERRL